MPTYHTGHVQAVLFSRRTWKTPERCREWLRESELFKNARLSKTTVRFFHFTVRKRFKNSHYRFYHPKKEGKTFGVEFLLEIPR